MTELLALGTSHKTAPLALRRLKRRMAGDDDWVPVRRSAAPQL